MKRKLQTLFLFGFAISLMALMFVIDLHMHPGLATPVLYSLIILYSWLLPGSRSSVVTALVCSVLTIAGLVAHLGQGPDGAITGVNRFISLIAIWITTALVVMAKQSLQGLLSSYKNLEIQVEQRAQELQQKDKLVRTMVDSVRDHAIFLIDRQGIIQSWNVGAARILGFTGLEIIGQSIESFFLTHHEPEKLRWLLDQAAQHGEASLEWQLVRADGQQFPASISLSQPSDVDAPEELGGYTVIVRDISQQRQMEEIRKNQAALEAKNSELGQLVSFASESLREPIKNCKNLLSIIHQDITKTSPHSQDYIQKAYSILDHSADNIDALLDYGLVGMSEPMEEVNLNELLTEIQTDMEERLAEEMVTVKIPGLPTITGQRSGLRVLFQNLISRPLGRWPEDGPRIIKLSVHPDEIFWKFTIEDTAQSIEPHQREQIFDFYAVNGNRHYDGRMAHCKRTVDLHDGSIWLEANLTGGNAFHFTLSSSPLAHAK